MGRVKKKKTKPDVLSFEPVQEDQCTLAPNPSMARTMRFKQLGIAKGKQPTGTTVDASCGNSLCFAAEHVLLRRWKSFGGKWAALATKITRKALWIISGPLNRMLTGPHFRVSGAV